jgi:UTP--glucose-1-phosphate uridylyltransferase
VALHETYGVDVPLVLMNSFNTHKDTEKLLRKYKTVDCKLVAFNQSKFPRIFKEALRPMPVNCSEDSEWYPPGHGDLYESLNQSGVLLQLLDEGKEWIFVSNIDNMGATVDTNILGYIEAHPDCEYIMEVTDKTKADVKGGTLIDYEGKLRLLEVAQVPKDKLEEFKSIKKFKIFNTNNLWIKLSAIKRLVEGRAIHMEVIENAKTLDDGIKIIQLERAVGSAIKNFNNPVGINVPRSRFLPVKKTADLLMVMSNLFTVRQGTLDMSPMRMFPEMPLIKLGDPHFTKVKDFLRRFDSIPDILELDHLTVSGNVTFGKNVVLKGTVIIIANHGDAIDIPSGAELENKIVTGNLRICDH